jgi:pyridinium-3,5-bisthiocarboxylic acid mononucleotide nickel chelatase
MPFVPARLNATRVKTLYLDIFSGLSGDMFIGAMLDLGLGLDHLERELAKVHLDGFHMHVSRAQRSQIEGTKFDVHLGHHHDPHTHEHGHQHDDHGHRHDHEHQHENEHEDEHEHGRSHADIRQLIADSSLSEWVKTKAMAVFQRIAGAEGKIHGLPAEQVHFHEVGAVDSIVDIVGACVALEFFDKPRVLASAVVDGSGWIDCAHGRFPIPAPATLEILAARGVAISQCDEPHELITPTGAALLAEFAESFGPMEGLAPERIGFGVGQRQNKTRPNVVRAILGRSGAVAAHDWETDTVAVLETNLDDANPEWLGHFIDKAIAAGALDVCQAPLHMKKNRPGVLLTVICKLADADQFSEWILRQTSAFGLRRTIAERRKLRREFRLVPTSFGPVSVKIGKLDGQVVQTAPEFESCRKLAEEKGVPLKAIYEAALSALHSESGPPKE